MKKLSISILLLFVMILSITAVAAADDVTSDLAKSQITDDSAALAVDGNTDVLAGDGGNFTNLQKDIDTYGLISDNYTRVAGENNVVISKEVTIMGSTIDAANQGGIFNVTSGGKLILKNVILKNGNSTTGAAIYNNGGAVEIQGTLTLTGNNATLGGVIYNNVGAITFNGGTITSESTTGTDLYNAKDGQIAIAAGSTFAGDVYNEGNLSSAKATYNGKFINNGTVDSIAEATFGADKFENYGTIAKITAATVAVPTVLNNGTITSMKGEFNTIKNNKEIGTINGTVGTLDNNGVIDLINTTTVTTLTNNGTVSSIEGTNFTALDNKENGTIFSFANSKSGLLRNYGGILSIYNSTLTSSLNNYANATIGGIVDTTINGGVYNFKSAYIYGFSNVTVAGDLSNNGNILLIDNSTLKAVTNGGRIVNVKGTTLTTLDTTANSTIGYIENAKITGLVKTYGAIEYIDNATLSSSLQVFGNGAVGVIEDSSIYGGLYNFNTIDTIDNVTVAGEVSNNGNITEIEDSTFKGAVTNNGNIELIEESTFKGAVTNTGNLTVEEGDFLAVAVNNNAGNMYVYESLFNKSNIVNFGNLLVDESAFVNNTVSAIKNTGNLTVYDTYFVNNTGAVNGGAINNQGNATIVGAVFYKNTATTQGGAIFSNGKLTVSDSDFVNNTAKYGGAVLVDTGSVAKITESYFINNNGTDLGKAIYNAGNLTLSENEFVNATVAEIQNNPTGFITAVKLTVTNNDTVYNYNVTTTLTATLTDVDGNWIKDLNAFKFVINGTEIDGTLAYNDTTGVYSLAFKASDYATRNITNADLTVTANLTAKYANVTATVTNGTLKTLKGTFTELQYLINNTAAAGTLVLPYNFAYNAEFDNVNLTKGVVINTGNIVIDGNGTTIDGKGVARIFFVNSTSSDIVSVKNITFTNGAANNGAAICVNGTANIAIDASVFTNNVATENGGAIYHNGQFINVYNSKFVNNSANAIYANKGYLNLVNNTVSKTSADIVLTKNATLNAVTINATVLEGKTLNITYGELVTLTAVITDENGNLINDPSFLFVVDGKKIPAIYDNGKYAFETNLYLAPSATVYPVTVEYNSTVTNTITGKAGGLNVSKEAVAIVIFAKDVVAGQNATIELMAFGANGDDLNGTNVTVTVNNVPYNVTIINGTGNITLPVLDLGTYHVYANWAGDENHNASSQVAEFGVKIATVMTISATNAGYDSALIKVTLTDGAGNKLSKFVKVYVADGVYEVAVKNGEGTQLVTGLKPGAYIADAEFSNDAEYADASNQTTFTVQPAQIVVTDMKRGWNSPYDYYATLLDAKGNPVAGKEITFTIDGVTYKATTNASGIATVAAKLDVGTHTVTVTNPDTGANSTATTTIVERIQGYGNITKDYLGPESYIVQVFGDDGNPVGENVVVEVRFAGKTYEMLTNASGYIVRTINFVPGFYAVYSVYAGYQTIQTAIVVNQILKVSAVTVKKSAKSFKLTATLKSSDGKAISGKEIKFTFAGKTYKAKTNSNGVATYKLGSAVIKKLKAGKKYTYKATYVNDIVKGKITVKK